MTMRMCVDGDAGRSAMASAIGSSVIEKPGSKYAVSRPSRAVIAGCGTGTSRTGPGRRWRRFARRRSTDEGVHVAVLLRGSERAEVGGAHHHDVPGAARAGERPRLLVAVAPVTAPREEPCVSTMNEPRRRSVPRARSRAFVASNSWECRPSTMTWTWTPADRLRSAGRRPEEGERVRDDPDRGARGRVPDVLDERSHDAVARWDRRPATAKTGRLAREKCPAMKPSRAAADGPVRGRAETGSGSGQDGDQDDQDRDQTSTRR